MTADTPPSPRSPLPEIQVCRGSRFWALGGESSDDEEDPPSPTVSPQRALSPRSSLAVVTFGDFLALVWNQVSSGAGGAGRARSGRKFAPGGHHSRFGGNLDLGSRSSLCQGARRAPVVVEGSGLGARLSHPSVSGDKVLGVERGSARRRDPRASPVAEAQDASRDWEVGGGPAQLVPSVVDLVCQSQRPQIPTRPLASLAQVIFGPPPPSPQAHSFRS
jgi:hypothetical protein